MESEHRGRPSSWSFPSELAVVISGSEFKLDEGGPPGSSSLGARHPIGWKCGSYELRKRRQRKCRAKAHSGEVGSAQAENSTCSLSRTERGRVRGFGLSMVYLHSGGCTRHPASGARGSDVARLPPQPSRSPS